MTVLGIVLLVLLVMCLFLWLLLLLGAIPQGSAYTGWLAFFTCLFLAAFIIFGTPGVARPAPLPLPRTAPPPTPPPAFNPHNPAGSYIMTWGGGEWNLRLSPSGTYTATTPNGSLWTGGWRVEDGVLWVKEAPVDESGTRGDENVWGVRWNRDTDGGCLSSGSVVRADGSVRTTISLTKVKRGR